MTNKKVLIVDDNQQITSLLKEILEMKDCDALIASTGQEALALYRDNDFDIVISDVKLEDINGLELVKQMQSIKSSGFIISSGYSDAVDKETMERMGIKGFLPKPFAFDDLFKLLES